MSRSEVASACGIRGECSCAECDQLAEAERPRALTGPILASELGAARARPRQSRVHPACWRPDQTRRALEGLRVREPARLARARPPHRHPPPRGQQRATATHVRARRDRLPERATRTRSEPLTACFLLHYFTSTFLFLRAFCTLHSLIRFLLLYNFTHSHSFHSSHYITSCAFPCF